MFVDQIRIIPFTYKHARVFARLRNEIDKEAAHVLAKKDERQENAFHVIARLLVSQRRTVTFLAFDDNFAVGYVNVVFPKFKKLRGNAYLTIAVREIYRGKGIGNALMERAENYAKERNVRRMELEVFGKNKGAIELYKRRGYEIEGVKKEAVEGLDGYDDIIIMAKKLK